MRKSLAALVLVLTGLLGVGLIVTRSRPDGAQTGGDPDEQIVRAPVQADNQASPQEVATVESASNRPEIVTQLAPRFAGIAAGDEISIPLTDGDQVRGIVNLVLRDPDGAVRIGGGLIGGRSGSFSLKWLNGELKGRVLLWDEELAYIILSDSAEFASGGILTLPLGSVICYPLIPAASEAFSEIAGGITPLEPQQAPPILSSRPTSEYVIYLHFVSQEDVDGGFSVTDPSWNDGNTIVPQKSSLTNPQIEQVWQRVKEDFWPFDLDITTDASRYTGAPVGQRMRVIITPTTFTGGGGGGVAYYESFTSTEVFGFSDDIPAWVFNQTVNAAAEAISHEVGHTLGLGHDGLMTGPVEYYQGQGSGATSWGPIMGSSYSRNVVQWSKGEYPDASNTEDDISIIAGLEPLPVSGADPWNKSNAFGYVADEAGNDRFTAADAMALIDGSNQLEGIVASDTDVDFYSFIAPGGAPVTITAAPATLSPNLDITLRLYDGSGTLLAENAPTAALGAMISESLAAGTYTVSILGSGDRDVNVDGYSNYGSIGYYQLTFAGIDTELPPSIAVDPATQAVAQGSGVTFSVGVTGTGPFTYQWYKDAVAIPGATGATYTISNPNPDDAGAYTVVVTNAFGNALSSAANLTVNYSRLAALAVRSLAGANDNTLIAGLVLAGGDNKRLIFRGVESTVREAGVPGTINDPQLRVYSGSALIDENEDWAGDANLAAAFPMVGLASLDPASRDAALLPELVPGVYTVHVTGPEGDTGVALMEVYDADLGLFGSRLTALAVRSFSGPGADVLIVGLIVDGNVPRQVVVRAVGPSLGAIVPTRMTDPELRLYSGATLIGSNDDWGGDPDLAAAFATVGLTVLANDSKDSAMLLTLDPGVYTIHAGGVAGSGIVLMEVYAVP